MIYTSSIVLSQGIDSVKSEPKYKPVIITNEYICFDNATIKAAAKALNDGEVYRHSDSLKSLQIKYLQAEINEKDTTINKYKSIVNRQSTIIQNEIVIQEKLKEQLSLTVKSNKKKKKLYLFRGMKIGFPFGLLAFGTIKILTR